MKLSLAGVALAALLAAGAAQAQTSGGAAAGAAAGAAGGAVVGGPVGAAAGGITGAIVGGALSSPDQTKIKEYVLREHRPSVKVQDKIVVGEALPSTVQFYEVPATVGVKTSYRYAVVNDRTVLVDPSTRKIVQVIE